MVFFFTLPSGTPKLRQVILAQELVSLLRISLLHIPRSTAHIRLERSTRSSQRLPRVSSVRILSTLEFFIITSRRGVCSKVITVIVSRKIYKKFDDVEEQWNLLFLKTKRRFPFVVPVAKPMKMPKMIPWKHNSRPNSPTYIYSLTASGVIQILICLGYRYFVTLALVVCRYKATVEVCPNKRLSIRKIDTVDCLDKKGELSDNIIDIYLSYISSVVLSDKTLQ